jgi:hypothetical protein
MPDHSHPNKAWTIGGAALLALAVVMIYLPMIHGAYATDDDWQIVNNPYMVDVHGLLKMLDPRTLPQAFYPLTLTVFWIERHIFGTHDPMPFHIVSIVLHITNVLLLRQLLKKLEIRWAAAAAFIFAVHPIQVETVAWISEQKTLLSCLFCFLTIMAYMAFLNAPVDRRATKRRLYYGLALLLFLMAMISKAVACTLPVALLLIVYWQQGRISGRDIFRVVPMLVGGLILAAIFASPNFAAKVQISDITYSPLERFGIATHAFWFYISKLIYPNPLLPVYPMWSVKLAGVDYLWPTSALGLILVLWALRKRVGRGPVVAVALFFLTLSPALGFISFSFFRISLVADHFVYPADVALIVLFVETVRMIGGRFSASKALGDAFARYWVQPAWIGLLAVLLAPQAWAQASLWGNQVALWRYVVQNNPQSWMAHSTLALQALQAGDPATALEETDKFIGPGAYPGLYYARGVALLQLGRFAEAILAFEVAEQDDYYHDAALLGLQRALKNQRNIQQGK